MESDTLMFDGILRMADKFSKQKRSEIMSGVRTAHTTPEVCVRKALHALGYRFRLQRKDLPGKPDIVLPKYKTVIFVHGCFWHSHTCKKGQTLPQTNADFWIEKLSKNVQRDRENNEALKVLGWNVVVMWECETKTNEKLMATLTERLSPITRRNDNSFAGENESALA
jgi:DNA mismatch endonuclease (patch repair protein)